MSSMSGSARGDDDPSQFLLESVQKAKRQTVATACQFCRKKRTKCDGQRPCAECTRRKIECVYLSKENETPQQANKRKFDELTQSHDGLQGLFETLAGQDERQAREIFQRIRNGHHLDSVLKFVRHGNVHQTLELSYEQRLRRSFLMTLVNSTASLREVVSVASSVLNSKSRIMLPPLKAYDSLRDTIITLESLSGVLSEANPQGMIEAGSARPSKVARIADGSYDGPLFWVPAEPWTKLTKNDEVVSELISTFFTFLNPSWRIVEEDVFIHDMRSRKVDSQYCSPVLVNSILAWASLYSEREDVFVNSEQYITRGEHFHDEALRLVALEEGRESITNIQALCVLSVETGLRAQDRLGLQQVISASAMNKALPMPDINPDMSAAARTYARVRACTYWVITHIQVAYSMSLLKGKDWLSVSFEDAPDLTELLPDTTIYWTGRPLFREPKEFRPNTMLHHRTIFDRFNWEVVELIITEDPRGRSVREFWPRVLDLTRRLFLWYESLPSNLQYSKSMPVPLLEFHASYYCTVMAVYEQTHVALFGAMNGSIASDVDGEADDQVEKLKAHLRAKALEYAYKAADCVRDFRELYGFKITQPLLLQAAVIGSFILLNDMKFHHPQSQRGSPDDTGYGSTKETQSGFEECFRLLIATGMQFMLPRGIARMVHQTARYLNVQLPDSVVQMMRAVAETAWHPSDVHQLRSSFPNWSILHNGTKVTEEYQMADLLKKWEGLGTEDQQMIEGSSANAAAA